MKLVRSLLFVLSFALFLNAEDDSKLNTQIIKSAYDNVVLKDSKKSLEDVDVVIEAITNKKGEKEAFSKLVKSWKSVETFYILADINEDFIDTPRYIDIFHNGNEDITKQLDRAIKSSDSVEIDLFKNSLKSINALEYILFTKDIKNKRVNEIALKIAKTIKSHLKDIHSEYMKVEEEFLKNLKKANAVIINAIIQNSYKLKEWRIGDVAGLTKKYENKPSVKRAEYYISKNSALAIQAVLETYKKVLDDPRYEDFGDYLLKITSGEDMKRLRLSLNKALELVKEIKNDDLTKANELYKEVNIIHVILFVEMIEELSINAKILDADGD